MSIGGTHKFTAASTTDQATYATASLTPAANKLYLLWIYASIGAGSPAVSTITGGGLTWALEKSVISGVRGAWLYRAMSASPGAGAALSLAFAATLNACGWSLWEYDGVDTSGSDGAGAIVQSVTGQGTATSGSITLTAFGNANNRPAIGGGLVANETINPESGYTGAGTATVATPNLSINSAWHSSATDTTPSMSWTSNVGYRLIAVELKVAAAPISGTLSKTLGTITNAAAGAVKVMGAAAKTLGALALAAAGKLKVSGAAARTLGSVTASAAGTVKVQGSAAKTLGAVTSSGAGTVQVAGQASATLGPVTSDGAGAVRIVGTASATLGDIELAAAGTFRALGAAAIQLGAISADIAGVVRVRGAAAVQLGAISADATGVVRVQGVSARTIGPVTLGATGHAEQIIQGVADIQLAGISVAAAGRVGIQGLAGGVLGEIELAAAGAVRVRGQAGIVLGAIMLAAAGRLHQIAPAERLFPVGGSSRRAAVASGGRIVVVEPNDRVSHA